MSGINLAAEGELVSLAGSNQTLVVVVALVALAALGVAAFFVREVLAADQGTDNMQRIALADPGGRVGVPEPAVPDPVGVRRPGVLPALPAPRRHHQRAGRPVDLLPRRRRVLGDHRLHGHVARGARQRARRRRGQRLGCPDQATRIAFRTGGVAGMFTVGLGLFGAAVVVLIYKEDAAKVLEGFGFGAAMLAMFMRVGGGIFTKAADVGADLVGKVEQGIPEDDPRNAATIADNVGDNVGDCAGMAADLFESYAVTLVAALILGKAAFGAEGLVFPLIVPAIGVLTAVIGIFAVSPRPGDKSGMAAINRGFFISAVISAVLVGIAAFAYLPATMAELTRQRSHRRRRTSTRGSSRSPPSSSASSWRR